MLEMDPDQFSHSSQPASQLASQPLSPGLPSPLWPLLGNPLSFWDFVVLLYSLNLPESPLALLNSNTPDSLDSKAPPPTSLAITALS